MVEVKLHGFLCAGKKLHDDLLRQAQEVAIMKFAEECLLHSRQRHPNIVQLIGVWFNPRSSLPTLVMEYVPMSLTQCLEKYQRFPGRVKHEILLDVAHGLNYLHLQKPPIWHRDLTANNVLLTSDMRAKISDLGTLRTAKWFRRVAVQLIQAPGNQTVMPPEALTDDPSYDHKLDVFSFGCLMIYVLVQEWPIPLNQYFDKKGKHYKRTELERRQSFVSKIDAGNFLLPYIKKCLLEDPKKRPDMSSLCVAIQQVLAKHPLSSRARLDLLWEIEAVHTELKALQKRQETKEAELGASQTRMSSLRTQNERKDEELVTAQKRIASLCTEKDARQGELAVLRVQVETLRAQNERRDEELVAARKRIASLCTKKDPIQGELAVLQMQVEILQLQARMEQKAATSPAKQLAGAYRVYRNILHMCTCT